MFRNAITRKLHLTLFLLGIVFEVGGKTLDSGRKLLKLEGKKEIAEQSSSSSKAFGALLVILIFGLGFVVAYLFYKERIHNQMITSMVEKPAVGQSSGPTYTPVSQYHEKKDTQVKQNVSDLKSIPVHHQAWEGWLHSARDDSVKQNVSDLKSIPVHHQTWEGWPHSARDSSHSTRDDQKLPRPSEIESPPEKMLSAPDVVQNVVDLPTLKTEVTVELSLQNFINADQSLPTGACPARQPAARHFASQQTVSRPGKERNGCPSSANCQGESREVGLPDNRDRRSKCATVSAEEEPCFFTTKSPCSSEQLSEEALQDQASVFTVSSQPPSPTFNQREQQAVRFQAVFRSDSDDDTYSEYTYCSSSYPHNIQSQCWTDMSYQHDILYSQASSQTSVSCSSCQSCVSDASHFETSPSPILNNVLMDKMHHYFVNMDDKNPQRVSSVLDESQTDWSSVYSSYSIKPFHATTRESSIEFSVSGLSSPSSAELN